MNFAGASSSYEEADYVLFGVPFDLTSSYRAGTRLAPTFVRLASYNLESLVLEKGVSLETLHIYDMGDIGEWGSARDMIRDVESTLRNIIINDKKFPIVIGGEHSLTIGVANIIKELGAGIIIFDAHLDFREKYLGDMYSHACVSRRIWEVVGSDRIISVGVRSMSEEELLSSRSVKYAYGKFEDVINNLSVDKVYVSIDVDVIDPAYAPGVGNPEPLGISPRELFQYLDTIFSNFEVIGVDIVEISPPYDPSGITSILGAKIIQRIIAGKIHANKHSDNSKE